MVRADLEGLVAAHDQSGLEVLLVLQNSDIASAAFLPLTSVLVELEELSTHLEELRLSLFMSLGLDLLGQLDNGLKVNIHTLGGLILASLSGGIPVSLCAARVVTTVLLLLLLLLGTASKHREDGSRGIESRFFRGGSSRGSLDSMYLARPPQYCIPVRESKGRPRVR